MAGWEVGTRPEVSPGHRGLSWSSGQQPILSKIKITGFDKPKMCEMSPFYWALRIKATAEVTGKWGESKKTENPCSFVQFMYFLESVLSFPSYKWHPVLPDRFTLKTFYFCHSKFLLRRRTRAEMCLPNALIQDSSRTYNPFTVKRLNINPIISSVIR